VGLVGRGAFGATARTLDSVTVTQVERAAGPAHRAAMTGTEWRAVGHAARRGERGGQQQR